MSNSTPSTPYLAASRDRDEQLQLQSVVKRHMHALGRPRKRRLTSPPDFQPSSTASQINKKGWVTLTQDADHVVKIVESVDDGMSRIHMMNKDAPIRTPHSVDFDAPSIPFVFNNGFFSFYTPSVYSSDSATGSSPPISSTSDASFLGVLPGSRRSSKPPTSPHLERLTIWQNNGKDSNYVYTQNNAGDGTDILNAESMTFSSPRYIPLYSAITRSFCRCIYLDIPLTAPPPQNIGEVLSISSIVTICTPRRGPLYLVTEIFSQGALQSSHKTEMAEETSSSPLLGVLYSAPLPQQFVHELCEGTYSGEGAMLDCIVILRCVEHTTESLEDEDVLVVICDFHTQNAAQPAQVKTTHLQQECTLQCSPYTTGTLPTPPSSNENLTDLVSSHNPTRRQRASNRIIPKLSVAIPPPLDMQGGKPRIQLCTDSPVLTPDKAMRPTPQTGVPQNVFPVTPFDQMIQTPLLPPGISRSTARSRVGFAPTPTESAYPFTLSSTSLDAAHSPAYGILDSVVPGGSAPAWLTLPRNGTPLTPSFFPLHPHTASASHTMSFITQRALTAGSPHFSIPHRDFYFDQPLASPFPIASAPLFPLTSTISMPLSPLTAPSVSNNNILQASR